MGIFNSNTLLMNEQFKSHGVSASPINGILLAEKKACLPEERWLANLTQELQKSRTFSDGHQNIAVLSAKMASS